MSGVELQPAIAHEVVAPAPLGAAAERFARNTLRRFAQTRRTYLRSMRASPPTWPPRLASPIRRPQR